MATPRFIGPTNTFLPEPTGMAVAYVRDPKEFKLNQYAQLINSPAPVGIYPVLDPDHAVRVVSDAEFRWEDGDDAPDGNHNLGNFKWEEFRVFRRAYPYSVGEQALNTAKGWNPKAFHDASVLSQAMTNRTYRVITMLENTSNWTGSTAAANTLNGGAGDFSNASADPGSVNYLAIRKAIQEAVRRIHIKTNGMVKIADLQAVLSPGLALEMSQTDEINAFLKNNQFALSQVKGNVPGQNANWGLPDMYAGLKLVVEDAVRVSARPYADGTEATLDTTKAFIKADSSMVICSRPGGLDGNYGAPSFSTVQVYYYKYEMAVESMQDSWNKKYRCRVVDQSKEVLAAVKAGYLITSCT